MEKLNGKYIGYPCTPSAWIGEPEYQKISRIKMSCGGGMGGSSWNEYVERIPSSQKLEGIITVKTINGKEIRLNTNNMVKIEDYTVVRAWYETSNQMFTKGKGKALRNVAFLVEDDVEVELINDYADKAKRMNSSL